ncbi:DUF3592 domain-containing protein [Nonomuraea sp. NPDC050556]|uniref:DUF3592 domain-containing protein n=1 Tax=Nonomuraea sp. NPDC050556 TaxID=3364369 RepID=UPI0037A465DD
MSYVYLGIVLLLGVAGAVVGRRQARGGLRLLAGGIRVLGTVTDLTMASAGNTRNANYYVTLRFDSQDGRTWETRSPVLMRPEDAELGAVITVVYDQSDPHHARIDSKPGLGIGTGLLVQWIGVALIVIAVLGGLVAPYLP